MTDLERVVCWLILLTIIGLGGLIYVDVSASERMALNGYIPLRLQGDSRTYWIPNPTLQSTDQLLNH
jgi:hypothetical protein